MEDERFRELLERVTNFNWPRPSVLRAECEEQRAKLYDLWNASTDEAKKAKLWGMYKAPAPAAVCEKYDEYRERLRKFRRTLRRDFPEWHYSDGPRVGQFVGGKGNPTPSELREDWRRGYSIQSELRKVWELASKREADKAKRELRKISELFLCKAERALAPTDSWYYLDPKEAATVRQMVKTLEWLQRRVGSLKVCKNPKCATTRKYFFNINPNDRYCSKRCEMVAKALRKAKRDAESQKPPKVYKFSEETRSKMSMSATLRHADERASKGKNKS